MKFRVLLRRATAAALTAVAVCALAATATADDLAPGTTAQRLFGGPGPHPVATTVRTNSCQDSVFGMIQHIAVHLFGNRDSPTCTQAFPNGLESPIGVNTYYPGDLTAPAPLLVFTPGINSNPGMYDALARQWASHGFVVVLPYDYVNSLAHVPTLGLATAVLAARDPNSPLYGRIDLSRTVFGGHSAGGQAALQAGALFPGVAAAIDPALRIAGVLAIQPGPLALGTLLEVPTLFLTGFNDWVVPDFAWVRWWQYNLTGRAPAWIANARGVSHFSPVDGLDAYLSAGTALAYLRYLAYGDDTAARFFTGSDWLLPQDKTYFSVQRNAAAAALD
ncbi:alpha/beta hydrolase [Nocardia sp. NPDC048505]|uniref:poly(ethylene terephthalate) hydrolase family protein n=1 Tax=unclassified Nocardia TaxID=2637762 RepID=UPI0033D1EBB6